jgi:hypothetical protein
MSACRITKQRWPKFATPWVALGLAIVCVGGQLSGFAHLLLIRHATCSEHGELIHADEVGQGGRHATERADPATKSSDEPGAPAYVAGTADSTGAHGHDHCPIAAHQRHQSALAGSSVVVSFEAHASRTAIVSQPAVRVPQLVLLFAPKNSPPA